MDFYIYQQKELRQGTSGEVFPKMLMNAQPRRNAHGYETFVHGGRTEASHHRLSEMTNNQVNVNAWNSIRPVEPSSRSREDRWNDQQGAFFQNDGQNENYQDVFSPSYCVPLPQNDFSYGRAQIFHRGTTNSYATPAPRQDCTNSFSRQPVSADPYQVDSMQADRIAKLDVMLGTPNYQWPWNSASSSSSYFGEDQALFLPCNALSDSLPPTSCGLPGAYSLRPRLPSNSANTPPGSLYSNYAMSGTIQDEPLSQVNFGAAIQSENTHNRTVWGENANATQEYNIMDGLGTSGFPASHCGLRATPSWFIHPIPTANWSQSTYEPSTISPKDLTLNATSIVTPVFCPEIFSTIRKDPVAGIKLENLEDSVDLPLLLKKSRKRLPGGRPAATLPHVPIIPSNNSKKITKNRARSPRTISPKLKPSSSKLLIQQPTPESLLRTRQPVLTPKKTQSKQVMTALLLPVSQLIPCAAKPKVPAVVAKPVNIQLAPKPIPELSQQAEDLKQMDSKNRFLVTQKLAGMSYKDIRKAGDFTEAESTLRGRFRTLTKDKEMRVRKPGWEANDIRLLKKAVRKMTRSQENKDKLKVPWKQVAEYIAKNGGSYHFGNATCRKKWDELQSSNGGSTR